MVPLTLYKDKSVGVFGLGKAGQATVAALLAGGAKVWAGDDNEKSVAALGTHERLTGADIKEWPWEKLEALVLSPGVPLTHPAPHAVVALAQKHRVPIVGDIELLYRQCPEATYVAITGTNGKSTTTALIGHILKNAGRKTEVGGNLGTAVLSFAPLDKDGIYVIETSSYQLDLLETARFNVAVLLNITPDHIDRHGDMQGYTAAKYHIFDRQGASDTAIVSMDDAYSLWVHQSLTKGKRQRVKGVTVLERKEKNPPLNGILVSSDGIMYETQHDEMNRNSLINGGSYIRVKEIERLPGRHNWQNAAAAYAACRAVGLSKDEIERGMQSFPGLAHRMQLIDTIDGVRFVNDSKATNAEATANALAAYDDIYWIIGGKSKEGGIASLETFFPRIRQAFLIGAAEEEFAKTLEGKVNYMRCKTLAVAVEKAAAMAFKEKKGVVLLSPACASFDQWKNFEERGEAFGAMVRQLKNTGAMKHAV